MMTPRGRWMALPGLVGLFLGVLRGQAELSLLSLSVLVWMAIEWALFSWRVWVELPRVQIERTVNGRSDPTGRHPQPRAARSISRCRAGEHGGRFEPTWRPNAR